MGKLAGAEKRLRNILIVGGAGWKNVGDDLIAKALKEWASSASHRVTVAGGPHPLEGDFDAKQVGIGGSLVARIRLGWHIARADYVLIGGGGLLDDRTPYFYRPFTRAATVCQLTRTRYAFAGIGVGPIRSEKSAEAYRLAVQRAETVYVRDRESRERLLATGLNRAPEIVPDPVLWDVNKLAGEPAQPRFDLAVNLRNWRSKDENRIGYDGPTNCEIIQTVAEAINNRHGREGRLALVSMSGHFGDDDSAMLEQLRHKLVSKNVTTYYDCALSEVQKALQGAATVLAMRLHACLVGFRSGRQVVGLAYDPKVTQQGKSLGFQTVPLDKTFTETGQSQVLEAFESAQAAGGLFPAPPLPWA